MTMFGACISDGPSMTHTVKPNRTLYRIHHISDRQREGLLRIKCVIYGTPFQRIFNNEKIHIVSSNI